MENRIAFCGLDCEQCDARRATVNDDRALREATAALWSQLNHTEILPDQIDCLGCRAEGVKTIFCEKFCAIRQCALQKQVETCGDCPEMEHCPKLAAITAGHPEARENLKEMR